MIALGIRKKGTLRLKAATSILHLWLDECYLLKAVPPVMGSDCFFAPATVRCSGAHSADSVGIQVATFSRLRSSLSLYAFHVSRQPELKLVLYVR